MSSTLPQHKYFEVSWELPVPGRWRLSGHSRALERSGFLLEGQGVRFMLDAGIDVPNFSPPDAIFVTHTHIDHCNALPMLVRHSKEGSPTQIFSPAKTMHRLRELVQLSFSMKVNHDEEVPERYCAPCATLIEDGTPVFEPWEASVRIWRPVVPGLTIPINVGKKGKSKYVIQTTTLYHNCTAVGYVISELKSKVRPDLLGEEDRITQCNVKAAKSRGEEVTIDYLSTVCSYICDTNIDALSIGPDAALMLNSPVIIVECTYLDREMEGEARKRGHICWSELLPILKSRIHFGPFTAVLMHFSLRYSDEEIIRFFNSQIGMGEMVDSGASECDISAPPHIILWLDSGAHPLWFKTVL